MSSTQLARELGAITISPENEVEAGSYGRWVFRYKAGSEGIKLGGSICIKSPDFGSWIFRPLHWEFGQVSAQSKASCKVRATINNFTAGQRPEIICTILGGSLHEGEEVEIVIGDVTLCSSYAFARAPLHAYHVNCFKTFVDVNGNDEFLPLENGPVIKVVHAKPINLVVTCPSVVSKEGNIEISVRAEDPYFNHAKGYTGNLKFFLKNNREKNTIHSSTIDDNGLCNNVIFMHDIDAKPATPFRIGVEDEKQGLQGTSHYLFPEKIAEKYQVYFGDIHAHGNIGVSDAEPEHGLRTLDEIYRYARDVMKLDFFNHSDGLIDSSANPSYSTELAVEKMKEYHQPGKFVTLPGGEIGGHQKGHFNIYFPDDEEPLPDAPEMKSYAQRKGIRQIEAYWNVYKDKRLLTIPHHMNAHTDAGRDVVEALRKNEEGYYDYAKTTHVDQVGWGPFDWTQSKNKSLRVVEIFQHRGSFEQDEVGGAVLFGGFGASVQNALSLGHRLGFIGSTDCHQGCPGNFHQLTKSGGLAGVLAEELTREAIFDALWERRCFATTGARIILEFGVNDNIMGSIIPVHKKDKTFNRYIKASIFGTDKIKQVDIVRNNKTIYSQNGTTDFMKCEWEDKEDIENVFKVSGFKGTPVVCYYLRVIQEDGNLACSSPVYFEF